MNRFFAFVLSLFIFQGFAQNIKYHWSAAYIKEGVSLQPIKVKMDPFGNTYLTGTFSDTLDADPGPDTTLIYTGAHATTSPYVIKLNQKGEFLWAANIRHAPTNNSAISVRDMKVDSVGNVYVVGGFKETCDFDPGPGVANRTSPSIYASKYLWKLDKNGNFVYVKTMGNSTHTNENWQIEILKNGNLFIPSYCTGILDMDPSPTGVLNIDFGPNGKNALLELTSSGNFVRIDTLPYPADVRVGKNHDYYLTGEFWGTQDFDPSKAVDNHTTIAGRDIFITKLDANFQYLWTKTIGGLGDQYVNDFELDSADNIILGGDFESMVDFDPGSGIVNLTTNGNEDAFIAKYDSSGGYLWAHHFGNSSAEDVRIIELSNTGDIYAGSYFTGTVDFDPGIGLYNKFGSGNTGYIVMYTAAGQFQWAQTFTSALSICQDIAAGPFDNVCTFGLFRDTVNANSTSSTPVIYRTGSYFNKGLFVTSLTNCPSATTTIDTIEACNAHTWINGVTYTQSDSSASILLQNIAGCDSLVNLYLKINYTDTSIAVANMTVAANQIGAKYQWIRCDWNNFVLPDDTNQVFVAKQPGYYAVVINDDGCIDTSRCVAVGDVSIPEVNMPWVTHYPNPTSNELTVVKSNAEELQLHLYSLNGKLIKQYLLSQKETQLDLDLPGGIYILEYRLQAKTHREKLIIQH